MSSVPQYKKIAFLAPRPDLSPEAFRWHWREMHGPVVSNAPGYATWRRRYVQNHVVSDGPFGRPIAYAGMAEFWLPDANEELYAQSSTYRDHVRPDERNFIDMDRTVSMTAVEHVGVAGSAQAKLVVLTQRNSGVEAAEYGRMLISRLAEVMPDLARIVASYKLDLVLEGSFRLPGARTGANLPIGALHSLWLRPEQLADATIQATLARLLALENRTFHDVSALRSFMSKELVFFEEGSPRKPSDTPSRNV